MNEVQVIDEIRRVQRAISASVQHDPGRIVDYYAELQRKYGDRIVNLSDSARASRTLPPQEAVSYEPVRLAE